MKCIVLGHVYVGDVEVLGQVASHPDLLKPVELDFGGSPVKIFQI